jgi:aspartokinase-like uncharacterized kinase
MKNIIIKIGGKILETPQSLESTISQFRTLLFDKRILNNVVIIPGGGNYANFIRILDKEIDLGDDRAHWMAIKAMEFLGKRSIKNYPEIEIIKEFDLLIKSPQNKKIVLFLPYEYLFKYDELPHSWNITSDSITLYLANKLKLQECFLIKDVDGILDNQQKIIQNLTTSEYKDIMKKKKYNSDEYFDKAIKKSQPIDSYLLTLIEKYNLPCFILNGNASNQTILDFFCLPNNKKKIYTKIESV